LIFQFLFLFIINVNHLLQLGTAGTANNCESQWRNKDTRDSWRKKGGDSHNLASITGERLSDLGALRQYIQTKMTIQSSL